jgi:Zn-dependent protease
MQAHSTARREPGGRSDVPAAILALLLKGKALLFSLFKLKVLFSIFTAVVSVFAYARGFGFAGAVGFVILIFVHEMGHVLVLRSQGVPASVPLFIPFVGAFINMKAYPRGAQEEAYSAIAGPILGSAGAFVCLAIYLYSGQQIWAWLAYIGFFINLFNLLPMSPLDGGRIVGAVWRGFWIIGVVAAVVMATWLDSPILLLFSVFGLTEINRRLIRVHWSAYALLGVMAIISSALCDEILWGFIIAFFAYSHCRRAQALNSYLAACQNNSLSYRVKIASGTPAHLAAADPLRLNLRDSLKHLPKTDLRSLTSRAPRRSPGKLLSRETEGTGDKYFSVPKSQRIIIGTMYTGLALVLSGLLIWMHMAGLFERPH